MPWPPIIPTAGRANSTPQANTHPDDHNKISAALTDIVAKINVTAWANLTLQNGATVYGAPFGTPQYRKEGDVVRLRGLVRLNSTNWPSAQAMATLPAGFRPPSDMRIIANGLATGQTVDSGQPVGVFVSGVIAPVNAAKDYLFLDGVAFSTIT